MASSRCREAGAGAPTRAATALQEAIDSLAVQLRTDRRDAFLDRLGNVDLDRPARRLEGLELAFQERRGHEAVLALGGAFAQELEAAVQVDDAKRVDAGGEALAIGFFQCGAAEDRGLLLPKDRIQLVEPW